MQNHKNRRGAFEHLLEYVDNMRIIDTHEHLHPYKNYLGDTPDVLCDYFSHYITTDLFSAGMSQDDLNKVKDFKINITERFKLLEPYLNCVKNTSYYRSLETGAKKVHNINGISIDTIEELNDKFKQAAVREDYGRYVMKDLCNIEVSINDCWSDDMKWATTDLFVPTCQFSPNGLTVNQPFDEYCENHRQYFLKQKNDGMKTIKNAMAYWRPIYFEDIDYTAAKEAYAEAMKKYISAKKENPEAESVIPKKLADYIMHLYFKAADENNFVIQIHTGLQEGMGNNLENSNPMLLENLFTKYPNLTFDIFHMGYPYERELMVLAKTHPNVYIDLCWAHIISPYAAKNAFYEMLDVLPYTKIMGFGGDYLFFDGVAGHLTMAKQNICTVLAEKISNDECDIDLAVKVLQAVLHDNAKRVFKL